MPRLKTTSRNLPIPITKKGEIRLKDNGEWKEAPANQNSLTALPPEILNEIVKDLNPIDTVCLSLAK